MRLNNQKATEFDALSNGDLWSTIRCIQNTIRRREVNIKDIKGIILINLL